MTNKSFTPQDTNICKGMAILAMVLHHVNVLPYSQFDPSWYADNSTGLLSMIILILSTAGKVCVALLTILSGYGMSKSYLSKKSANTRRFFNLRFTVSHLLQFYSIYWIWYLCYLPIRLLNGGSLRFPNFLTEFFGISNLFENGFGSWFVGVIVLLYVLFPILYNSALKLKYIPLILSLIPWVFKLVYTDINKNPISTDNVIFYIAAFLIGIYFSQNDFLPLCKRVKCKKYTVLSIIFVILSFIFRVLFGLIGDLPFAISIILFEVFVLSEFNIICHILEFFGKNSANIWLSHGTIIKIISLPVMFKYPAVFIISLTMSVIVEFAKKITGYNKAVKSIRLRIA